MAPAQQQSESGLPQQWQQWPDRTGSGSAKATIILASKIKLYKSLVTSILLHGCETWTLLADSEKKKIKTFRTECIRKLLRIFHFEHKTNHRVWSKINFFVCPREPLVATVKRRKLAWFGHATRHDNLSQTVLQCTLEVGDAVVGRANVEWTTSKSGHICLCRTAHKGFPQKRLEEDLC